MLQWSLKQRIDKLLMTEDEMKASTLLRLQAEFLQQAGFPASQISAVRFERTGGMTGYRGLMIDLAGIPASGWWLTLEKSGFALTLRDGKVEYVIPLGTGCKLSNVPLERFAYRNGDLVENSGDGVTLTIWCFLDGSHRQTHVSLRSLSIEIQDFCIVAIDQDGRRWVRYGIDG